MARFFSRITGRLSLSTDRIVGQNVDFTEPTLQPAADDVPAAHSLGTENIATLSESMNTASAHSAVSASSGMLEAGSLPSPPTLAASCVVVEDDDSPATCQSQRRNGHRRYHRHHRSSSSRRHHRICRIKWKEVNFLAIMSSVIAAVLICTSLAEPHWWYIRGGKCRDLEQQPISYLGVRTFFFECRFDEEMHDGQLSSVCHYGSLPENVLIDCITQQTVHIIQVIIALCFLVIIFSLAAIVIDLVSFSNRFMKGIRQSAIFSILSVCLCVTVNGMSYVVTQQLTAYYESNPLHQNSKIDVEFSLSFYTIMAAGILSVFAVAFALLCQRVRSSVHRWSPTALANEIGCASQQFGHNERLINADFNQLGRSGPHDSGCAAAVTLPSVPPPPYAP